MRTSSFYYPHRSDLPADRKETLIGGSGGECWCRAASLGVKMDVWRGVLIVGLEEIEGKSGEKVNPGLLSGLQIGDIIMEINGTEVYRADEVQSIVNEAKGTVRLKVKRNDSIINVEVNPVESGEDGL